MRGAGAAMHDDERRAVADDFVVDQDAVGRDVDLVLFEDGGAVGELVFHHSLGGQGSRGKSRQGER